MKSIIAVALMFSTIAFAGGGSSQSSVVAKCINNSNNRLTVLWSDSHGYYIVSDVKINDGVFYLNASGWNTSNSILTINFSGKDFNATYKSNMGFVDLQTNKLSDLNFQCLNFKN